MPSERTFVTEIATGLGMVGELDLASVIARRPPEMTNLTASNWEQLTMLWGSGRYATEFSAGFLNGQAFLAAADALNGLEHLAAIAIEAGVVDVDLQVRLVDLHDRYRAYTAAHLHLHQGRLERHVVEAEAIGDDDPLLTDARQALSTAVSLVYRR